MNEKVKALLAESSKGIITTTQVTDVGLHRGILQTLYLLGYSDRTPAQYMMTFPKGYNAPSLRQENIDVRRVVKENYSLGIIEFE